MSVCRTIPRRTRRKAWALDIFDKRACGRMVRDAIRYNPSTERRKVRAASRQVLSDWRKEEQ